MTEEQKIESTENLLRVCLSGAVPMWIQHFIHTKRTLSNVLLQAEECGNVLSEKGDVLIFGGKGCAAAFNAMACGLAAASFVPGGVRAFGLHFESDPSWLRARP